MSRVCSHLRTHWGPWLWGSWVAWFWHGQGPFWCLWLLLPLKSMGMSIVPWCYLLSVDAHRHGRAWHTAPLKLQVMVSGLDADRKWLIATLHPTRRTGHYGCDHVQWVCGQYKMGFFFLVFSFFSPSSFLCWGLGSHKGQRWMWEEWEVPVIGMHDVKFPNNQ